MERDGNIKCFCDLGYIGGLCDIKIDFCINLFCIVGNCFLSLCGYWFCFGDNYNFICVCEFGFIGLNCYIIINMI